KSGLLTGILSGRQSDATTRRAAELGIDIVVQADVEKRVSYARILAEHRLTDAEVAFMGDDVLDLSVLGRVGLPAAPADAVPEVRAAAHWVSTHAGGRGAVREFIEAILKARGDWEYFVRALDHVPAGTPLDPR